MCAKQVKASFDKGTVALFLPAQASAARDRGHVASSKSPRKLAKKQ